MQEDLLGTGQPAVVPGRIRIFQIAVGDAGVPNALINRDAEFVGLGLAGGKTEGVVTAADDDGAAGIQFFDQVIFAYQALAAVVGTQAKAL